MIAKTKFTLLFPFILFLDEIHINPDNLPPPPPPFFKSPVKQLNLQKEKIKSENTSNGKYVKSINLILNPR